MALSRVLIHFVVTGLVAASLVAPARAAEPTGAAADSGSVLPTKAAVKQLLNGTGKWSRHAGDITVLGSRPAACRSDLQMLQPTAVHARWYWGREANQPRSVVTRAEVAVFRYPSAAAARAALARNASYPRRCPKVTEWVCEDCDGILTTRREHVKIRRVGVQRTAWRLREVGNFLATGYGVVARSGSTLVRVTVTRADTDLSPQGFPPLIKRRVVLRLARSALDTAT